MLFTTPFHAPGSVIEDEKTLTRQEFHDRCYKYGIHRTSAYHDLDDYCSHKNCFQLQRGNCYLHCSVQCTICTRENEVYEQYL